MFGATEIPVVEMPETITKTMAKTTVFHAHNATMKTLHRIHQYQKEITHTQE